MILHPPPPETPGSTRLRTHGDRRRRGRRVAGLALVCLALAGTARLDAAEEIVSGGCRVRLLGRDDADEISPLYRKVIVKPYEKHRQVVREGLARMTPLLCAAVRRVVFVEDPSRAVEDGWVRPSEPDLAYVNYDPLARAGGAYARLRSIQAFLHEATHAADLLLQAHHTPAGALAAIAGDDLYADGEADADDWPADAGRLAESIVADNRIAGGMRAEWSRLHRTFEELGLAGAYQGKEKNDAELAPAKVATQGFMSPYGASEPGEDIAEFASWMMAAPVFARNADDLAGGEGAKDFACQAMRGDPGPAVHADLSAAFTKANFLLSAGFVSREAYERCVGKLHIEGRGEGVFVYELASGTPRLARAFDQGVRAEIGTDAKLGQYVFLLEASGRASFAGKEHAATVELRLPLGASDRAIDQVSWPRGIYSLRSLGSDFRLEMPEAPAGTFVAIPFAPDHTSGATVLVAYATNHRLEGSIFLRHAIRPYAPLPVPQTGLPLRFTFKLRRTPAEPDR